MADILNNEIYLMDLRMDFNSDAASVPVYADCIGIDGYEKRFFLALPDGEHRFSRTVLVDYIASNLYNILSTLGGIGVTFHLPLGNAFALGIIKDACALFQKERDIKDRNGFGKVMNIIERMNRVFPNVGKFAFTLSDIKDMKEPRTAPAFPTKIRETLRTVDKGISERTICGIDIGGTDVKIAVSRNGNLVLCKEFDWFPATFTDSKELAHPVAELVHLLQLAISAGKDELDPETKKIVSKSSDMDEIAIAIKTLESRIPADKLVYFDTIGICFPDVVVRNMIVGGEVYKNRGIREAHPEDYDSNFAAIQDYGSFFRPYIKKDGGVHILNDGPMAAFTAAVEKVFDTKENPVDDGIFAFTLGTELGTGWLREDCATPDVPLEIYNLVVDIKKDTDPFLSCDDIRSKKNFNTLISGTLQKYTSQSGVFRLAYDYFKAERPDLLEELYTKGLIVDRNGGVFVNTEERDMRKPFLSHLITLIAREKDSGYDDVWRKIGEYVAVASAESDWLLGAKTHERVLFGRLVKNDDAYRLMCEGMKERGRGMTFSVANDGLACSPLMRELKNDRTYTVPQFAQSIGCVYYANLRTNN